MKTNQKLELTSCCSILTGLRGDFTWKERGNFTGNLKEREPNEAWMRVLLVRTQVWRKGQIQKNERRSLGKSENAKDNRSKNTAISIENSDEISI